MKKNLHFKKTIGLLGGVFDPVHYGHLIIAQQAQDIFNLEKVIFIPCGNPSHKKLKLTNKFLRAKMVALSIQNNPKFQLSRLEIFKKTFSYTLDTVLEFKKIYPKHQIYFIAGIDAVLNISTWHKADELKKICPFIIATRPDFDENKLPEILGENLNWIKLMPIPLIDISSTDIRQRIKEGKSITYLVPEKVENFIYSHQLYL